MCSQQKGYRRGVRTYLDHAATTPARPEAREAFLRALDAANASATHVDGQAARRLVEEAREAVADALNCSPHDVVFTSGGTEADNLAIKGVVWAAAAQRGHPPHVITSAVEHAAVLETLAWLERRGEAQVTRVAPRADGRVDAGDIAAGLGERTALVSVMAANNETGAVNDIPAIVAAVDGAAVVHTDAVQAFATVDVDVQAWGVDAVALSGHKFGAPQGVGVAVLRRNVPIDALVHGGGQERDVRSGTYAVGMIAAFAAAVRVAVAERTQLRTRLAAMSARLARGLCDIEGVRLTGPEDSRDRLASHVHIMVDDVDPAGMALALDAAGVAVSSGAACGSGAAKASHVLEALGAVGTPLRLSLGWTSTDDDVDHALGVLTRVITASRAGATVDLAALAR